MATTTISTPPNYVIKVRIASSNNKLQMAQQTASCTPASSLCERMAATIASTPPYIAIKEWNSQLCDSMHKAMQPISYTVLDDSVFTHGGNKDLNSAFRCNQGAEWLINRQDSQDIARSLLDLGEVSMQTHGGKLDPHHRTCRTKPSIPISGLHDSMRAHRTDQDVRHNRAVDKSAGGIAARGKSKYKALNRESTFDRTARSIKYDAR
jgi:hypothetical protein